MQEQKKIIEQNKLIAEFMGGTMTPSNGYRGSVIQFPVQTHFLHCHPLPDLKYHTSWDWLMPVVDKISRHKFDDGSTSHPLTFGMISSQGLPMFRFNRGGLFMKQTLIEATFLACIEFIQWYNNQKS